MKYKSQKKYTKIMNISRVIVAQVLVVPLTRIGGDDVITSISIENAKLRIKII